MMVGWIKGMIIPLLAVVALTACQKQPKYPTYAAAPSCGPHYHAPPSPYNPPPVSYTPQPSCPPVYRPPYHNARAPSSCAYLPRDYRYAASNYGSPQRSYYHERTSSCCY